MPVSDMQDGRSYDMFTDGFRLAHQSRTVENTASISIPESGAPVQYVTPSGSGPGVVRLPLQAKDGKVFIIVNMAADTNAITLTDNAGTPNTIGTIEANTTMWAQKIGTAGTGSYRLLMAGAANA